MKTLYPTTTARKTRRTPATVVGYYSTPEAAEQLGVDPNTLKYRRDTADARAYWDLLGVSPNDPMYRVLAESHMIYNKHHYYKKNLFDKFVKIYTNRPEVIRARKRHLKFPKGKVEILSYNITDSNSLDKILDTIVLLFKSDGQLNITLNEVN